MILIANSSVQGVSEIIRRKVDKPGMEPKTAYPGDQFKVKTDTEEKRLLRLGVAEEVELEEEVEVKKAPAKKPATKKAATKKAEATDEDLGL